MTGAVPCVSDEAGKRNGKEEVGWNRMPMSLVVRSRLGKGVRGQKAKRERGRWKRCKEKGKMKSKESPCSEGKWLGVGRKAVSP